MTKKKSEAPKKIKKRHCFSCGCVTGAGYLENNIRFKKRNLCGSCMGALERRGFCIVADDTFLLESGELVTVPRKDRTEFLNNVEHERRTRNAIRRNSSNHSE